jgi:hypothetical protein
MFFQKNPTRQSIFILRSFSSLRRDKLKGKARQNRAQKSITTKIKVFTDLIKIKLGQFDQSKQIVQSVS